jgi:Fur family ferric uptake transcriptional regulator
MFKGVAKMLSNQHIRMTRQRQMILDLLRDDYSHPTASEVYQKVRERMPQISLGTVYRNLEILCKQGIIRKLELAGAQKRFDGTLSEHYHVRCLQCGQISDIKMEPITALEDKTRELCDYDIVGHRLEFIGVCPRCRKEKKRSLEKKTATSFTSRNIP